MHTLRSRWERYLAEGSLGKFIEFSVAVNSFTEYLSRLRLAGLMRLSEGLENVALSKLDDAFPHPMAPKDMAALQRQIDSLLGAVTSSLVSAPHRRVEEKSVAHVDADWIKPRTVWLVAEEAESRMADALANQLKFFGFQVLASAWKTPFLPEGMPLAVLFMPAEASTQAEAFERIAAIRAQVPASQLFYLSERIEMDSMVALMRIGIDQVIPVQEQPSMVLNCILDLVQTQEQAQYRVLVVEDSRVAVALIRRTLTQHGIETQAITDPGELLDALASYRPDLILMDMHMPRFNGIEATRVLRQIASYDALPIVYLSGESDVGLQVEALRLGGDQFLSKPFNPVLLAAVVKTRIERYREARRSTQLDGLTGLLNHTAAKSRLAEMVDEVGLGGMLTVAMIDIDHFKSINDTYGHPVGDQVIRGLAWLLKGRLRSVDLIGRYGGEEFLLALPGVSLEQAQAAIDGIRRSFAELPHAHPNGALHATFSAGVAAYPLVETAAGLTEAADAALLQAKRLGRNRVVKSP